MAVPAANQGPEEAHTEWSEPMYKEALEHLQQLQDQLDQLRRSIPDILDVLATSHATPTDLYRSFELSAGGAVAGIKELRTVWNREDTKRTMDVAMRSTKADLDLDFVSEWRSSIASVQLNGASTNGDSGTLGKFGTEENGDVMEGVEAEISQHLKPQKVREVVENITSAHPAMTVSLDSGTASHMQVRVPAGAWKLQFVLHLHYEGEDVDGFDITCTGSSAVCQGVSRCLTTRHGAKELEEILDMLSQYQSLQTAKCAKCNRLLDDAAMVPVARQLKPGNRDSGGSGREWLALHENCLP